MTTGKENSNRDMAADKKEPNQQAVVDRKASRLDPDDRPSQNKPEKHSEKQGSKETSRMTDSKEFKKSTDSDNSERKHI